MKRLMVVLLGVVMVFLLMAGINFFMNNRVDDLTRIVVGGLLIIDFFMYGVLLVLRNSQHILVRICWICVVVGNILLTLVDNIGLADILFLVANGLILLLYIKGHSKDEGRGMPIT